LHFVVVTGAINRYDPSFDSKSVGNFRDFLLFVSNSADRHAHICELQFVVTPFRRLQKPLQKEALEFVNIHGLIDDFIATTKWNDDIDLRVSEGMARQLSMDFCDFLPCARLCEALVS
jgi:hypothetical protein